MRTAIITGASRGIGRGIANYFASKQFQLLLVARDLEKLKDFANEIATQFPNTPKAEIAALDVSDHKAVTECVNTFGNKHGRIDFLCNNAGYAMRGSSELDHDEFFKMIDTNLVGAFNFIHAVTPFMKKNHEGRIVNIASRSGKIARKFLGGYAASKFGLVGLSEGVFKELAPENIHVTTICPAFVATDMTSDMKMDQKDMIQVSDIVKTIEFLMQLSPSVAIPEITLECRRMVILENDIKF